MTLQVEINPGGIEAEYLSGLNACFDGWGDIRHFRWAFERTVGGPGADLIVLRDGAELVAGSAVTYRRVTLAQGGTFLAGIMTGSFTRPSHRRRGCFATLIEKSTEITREHGGALLLAFVTDSNASFRRLLAAGAADFPAYYLVSNAATPLAPSGEIAREASGDALGAAYGEQDSGATPSTRIRYPDVDGWLGQMLERGRSTAAIETPEKALAIVEDAPSADRVLFLSSAARIEGLLRRAQERGKALFLFTMDGERKREATSLGLSLSPGHLTALVADVAALSRVLGTRASSPDTSLLSAPGSPGYLGPWNLHGGDRM